MVKYMLKFYYYAIFIIIFTTFVVIKYNNKMIVNNLDNFEKFGIYKITNLKNNKIYVGSTGRSFKDRFNDHSRDLKMESIKIIIYNLLIINGEKIFLNLKF